MKPWTINSNSVATCGGVVCMMLVAAPPHGLEAQTVEGAITGVVVAEREQPEGDKSLLVASDSASRGFVDEVRVSLPPAISESVALGHGPEGWTLRYEDGRLIASGARSMLPLHLRFDLGGSEAPETVDVEFRYQGELLFQETEAARSSRPPPVVSAELSELLELPAAVFPGGGVQVRVRNPSMTPLSGLWRVAGQPVIELGASMDGEVPAFVEIPLSVTPGASLPVTYFNHWGEQLVDVAAVEDVTVYRRPRPDALEQPRLTGVTPRVFRANRFCTCGYFPTYRHMEALQLDGMPVGPPTSASNYVLWFDVPEEASLGSHRLTGSRELGFPAEDAPSIHLVQLAGSIDQEKLWRGEATELHLRVTGTADPISIELRNTTPGIISLGGGDHQIITTSGGTENFFSATVRGTTPGDFRITYRVASDPCPCAGNIPDDLGPTVFQVGTGGVAADEGDAGDVPPDALPEPAVEPDEEEETTVCCGPDVTRPVLRTLRSIRQRALAADYWDQWSLCTTGVLPPGAADSWDINLLFDAFHWTDYDGGRCAQRGSACEKTVEFMGHCYHAAVVNYLMWGVMNEVCTMGLNWTLGVAHAYTFLFYGPSAARAVGPDQRIMAYLGYRFSADDFGQSEMQEVLDEHNAATDDYHIFTATGWYPAAPSQRREKVCPTTCGLDTRWGPGAWTFKWKPLWTSDEVP